MTDSTPVGQIAATLEAAGYERVADPVVVSGLKFDFPAAFVQKNSTSDLILVADSANENGSLLAKKVDGVARALDISRSTRSLTLLVAGPRPSTATLESIGRVCRVLPVGNISGPDAGDALQNWLAVLLPFNLSPTETASANPLAHVSEAAKKLDDTTQKLIDMATHGTDAVRKALHAAIDKASQGPDKETA